MTDQLGRSFLIAGLIFFFLLMLIYGSSIFIPFSVALLIWFLINAAAGGLQKLKIGNFQLPRAIAIVLALFVTFNLSMLALDLVVSNISALSSRAPEFQQSLNPLIDKAADFFGMTNADLLNKILDQLGLERLLTRVLSATASFSSQIGTISIYIIFLLIEQQFFQLKLRALIKDEIKRNRVEALLDAISKDIQAYMLIMTFISLITAVLSYIAMTYIGLEHAEFWAFIIFILNFIPTVGSILSTAFPTLFALVQFQDFAGPLKVFILVGLIQFLIGNFLQPRLAGKTLLMSQLVVVLALFVWGAIWGIVGMFLAVPIMAILMIILANFELTRPAAILMSQDGRLKQPDL